MASTIQSGRSYRDLPPHPPTGPIAERPDAQLPPEEPPPPERRRWWPLALLGLFALVAGLVVGVWTPWEDMTFDLAAAPTTTTTLAPIVPPGIPSTTLPPAGPPQGSPFPAPSPEEQFSFRFPGLVDPASVPSPFIVVENGLELDGAGVRQRLTVDSPNGPLVIEAVLTPDGALPEAGEVVDLRGTTGRVLSSDEGTTLTWIENGLVSVTITAPPGFDQSALLALAESLEVAP